MIVDSTMENTIDIQKDYKFPADRRYDAEHHMWAKHIDGGVLVGIDSLGLESMGDLAYVVVLPAGSKVKRGQSFGSMEAAKMTGDLYSPVSGTILAVNNEVVSKPSNVNNDNYGQGWLTLIAPDDWQSESSSLIADAQLPAWITAETERYRRQGWVR